MNLKKVIIFLILIILTCLIVSCQKDGSDATANWELYENSTLGYSMKYPQDCTFGPMPPGCKQDPPEQRPPECLCFLNSENPNQVFMQSFDEGTGGELTMASFSIDQLDTPAWHPPAGSELIPWLEANFTFPPDYLPSETNMEVDGVEAVRIYSPSSQQAPSSEEIYFIHDSNLIAIRLLDVDLDVNRQLYDNIIRTFQFE